MLGLGIPPSEIGVKNQKRFSPSYFIHTLIRSQTGFWRLEPRENETMRRFSDLKQQLQRRRTRHRSAECSGLLLAFVVVVLALPLPLLVQHLRHTLVRLRRQLYLYFRLRLRLQHDHLLSLLFFELWRDSALRAELFLNVERCTQKLQCRGKQNSIISCWISRVIPGRTPSGAPPSVRG